MKDLADISSILSIASSSSVLSGLQHQQHQHRSQSSPRDCLTNGSSCSSSDNNANDEVYLQAFAAEFRKMKEKGEFPCKLCDVRFPNLRALKGHNRAHMNVEPGMEYPCNMCPYKNKDKATLTKHLRSHNGDRPFVCLGCKYAFTTKANCERHVRKRHGLMVKEEVHGLILHVTEEGSAEAEQGECFFWRLLCFLLS